MQKEDVLKKVENVYTLFIFLCMSILQVYSILQTIVFYLTEKLKTCNYLKMSEFSLEVDYHFNNSNGKLRLFTFYAFIHFKIHIYNLAAWNGCHHQTSKNIPHNICESLGITLFFTLAPDGAQSLLVLQHAQNPFCHLPTNHRCSYK